MGMSDDDSTFTGSADKAASADRRHRVALMGIGGMGLAMVAATAASMSDPLESARTEKWEAGYKERREKNAIAALTAFDIEHMRKAEEKRKRRAEKSSLTKPNKRNAHE